MTQHTSVARGRDQQTDVAQRWGLTRVTDCGDVTCGLTRRDGRHGALVTHEALHITESGINKKIWTYVFFSETKQTNILLFFPLTFNTELTC